VRPAVRQKLLALSAATPFVRANWTATSSPPRNFPLIWAVRGTALSLAAKRPDREHAFGISVVQSGNSLQAALRDFEVGSEGEMQSKDREHNGDALP
jgi:hypothetical protein